MWTIENRARNDRSRLRYPSDVSDDDWNAGPIGRLARCVHPGACLVQWPQLSCYLVLDIDPRNTGANDFTDISHRNEVEKIYDRWHYLPQLRDCAERYEAWLSTILC